MRGPSTKGKSPRIVRSYIQGDGHRRVTQRASRVSGAYGESG